MSKNLSLFQGLTALPTHFYLFTFGLTQSVMRAVAHRRTTAHGVRCGTSLNTIPRFNILADALTASCFYRGSDGLCLFNFCTAILAFGCIPKLIWIPTIAIPLFAPPITGDGFGPLFLRLFGFDVYRRSIISHSNLCNPS